MTTHNKLGYKKADPLLMLKIGDWKQFGIDEKICGLISLNRGDKRLGETLRKRRINIMCWPEPGKRVVDFHDTPVSVVAAILPLKCIVRVELQQFLHFIDYR